MGGGIVWREVSLFPQREVSCKGQGCVHNCVYQKPLQMGLGAEGPSFHHVPHPRDALVLRLLFICLFVVFYIIFIYCLSVWACLLMKHIFFMVCDDGFGSRPNPFWGGVQGGAP